MKKLIAFDQDDTINITKSPIDLEMALLLANLLDEFKICIISGTNWEVMRENNIRQLSNLDEEVNFKNLFILPTSGTQLWHYVGVSQNNLSQNQIIDNGWKREYYHSLSEEQVELITAALKKSAKRLGLWCENPNGDIIENRGSQVTFSALGQWANASEKHSWDPNMKKRESIVQLLKPELANIGVKIVIGGATSIDVTLPGIDKAYGMRKLIEETALSKEDILFIGDKLKPGGNDYPVKNIGIDTIEVTNAEDTKWILKGFLGLIK